MTVFIVMRERHIHTNKHKKHEDIKRKLNENSNRSYRWIYSVIYLLPNRRRLIRQIHRMQTINNIYSIRKLISWQFQTPFTGLLIFTQFSVWPEKKVNHSTNHTYLLFTTKMYTVFYFYQNYKLSQTIIKRLELIWINIYYIAHLLDYIMEVIKR